MGRVPASEVGGNVHEQGGRGHRPVLKPDDVVDRLERRTGLPPAVAQDVELWVEQTLAGSRRVLDLLLVEARAAGVGEHLARTVVDCHQRAVVHVAGPQAVGIARGRVRADDAVVVV